jgi:alkylated DNA repair dioxygenase AlkB
MVSLKVALMYEATILPLAIDMNLFTDPSLNLLPYDGTANYYGEIFDPKLSVDFFKTLENTIDWKNDEVKLFGKKYITARKVAWYAEKPFIYTYSNATKTALNFTNELLEIKQKIEELSGQKYNSCLLNKYHNGQEGMGWHSDDERELVKNAAIASISFGAERKFVFKHRTSKETKSIILENGSLLIMKDEIQDFWFHRLPPTQTIQQPRINLTFRLFKE